MIWTIKNYFNSQIIKVKKMIIYKKLASK